jgi:hypothetical protein
MYNQTGQMEALLRQQLFGFLIYFFFQILVLFIYFVRKKFNILWNLFHELFSTRVWPVCYFGLKNIIKGIKVLEILIQVVLF